MSGIIELANKVAALESRIRNDEVFTMPAVQLAQTVANVNAAINVPVSPTSTSSSTSSTSTSSTINTANVVVAAANTVLTRFTSAALVTAPTVTPTPIINVPATTFAIGVSTATAILITPTGAVATTTEAAFARPIEAPRQNNRVVVIAGAVAGGVVLLAVLIGLLIYKRKVSNRTDEYGDITRKTSKSGKVYNIRQLKIVSDIPIDPPRKLRETGTNFCSSFYSTDVDLPFKLGSPIRESRPTYVQKERLQSMKAEQSRFSEHSYIASSGVQSFASEGKVIESYMDAESRKDRVLRLMKRALGR